jgi:SAM-dependent methyltransferase
MPEFDFIRYLNAKRSVDDRALNKDVLQTFSSTIQQLPQPIDILEIGAGMGTMCTRLIDWKVIQNARYTLLDNDAALLKKALEHLQTWSRLGGHQFHHENEITYIKNDDLSVYIEFAHADLQTHELPEGRPADVLIANAVLDLLDLKTALPRLFATLKPGGYFYFTINYDGETIFEPVMDAAWEEQVMTLYNRSMDQRIINGQPSGDSRTGRRLFREIPAAKGTILTAGSSDWAVFAQDEGYPEDEARFLEHILHFFERTLSAHPDLDQAQFAAWLAERRMQIKKGELVYIAHQFDFFGRVSD